MTESNHTHKTLPSSGQRLWQKSKTSFSFTSLWILCCSCSFNNSFQEGCLGSVRLELGKPKSTARAKSKKKLKAPNSVLKVAAMKHRKSWKGSVVTSQPLRIKRREVRTPQGTTRGSPKRGKSDRKPPLNLWFVSPQRLQHLAQKQRQPKTPSTLSSEPVRVKRVPSQNPALAMLRAVQHRPRLLRTAQEEPKTLQLPLEFPPHQLHRLLKAEAELSLKQKPSAQILRTTIPSEIWEERPQEVVLCYHKKSRTAGWGQPHFAQNTQALKHSCERARALGTGNHWTISSDVFATSHVSCRLFFSVGRVAVVANCGQTLYRAPIRKYAACLQHMRNCAYPHLRMYKLPLKSQQAVEIRI
ncbi:MAG: hypothetical protein AAGJ35_11935, partial [Myxococcota bacterium]